MRGFRRFASRAFRGRIASLALAATVLTSAAHPQSPNNPPAAKPQVMENCPGLVAHNRLPLVPVAFQRTALDADQVRITFVGHATFLIESPQLVRIATDYNDYVRPPVLPDIATMNHAHDTHYTDNPDPAIKYVLRGWGESPDKPRLYDMNYRDVRVRNVPTNIRTWSGGTEFYGNSIFIFETANLCIAHLGHLHHTLTKQQLDDIGRLDVVLAPVDGTYTLDLDGMMEVLTALNPPVVIPMHFFDPYTLDRFVRRAQEKWPVEVVNIPRIVISKATLPKSTKVLVLPGH
jgi:L-ascorbate metabolism protein UlaG (beta-lactamase superfamily)